MANVENPTVWVLLDDRAGNNNQSRGLADKLGFPYELVQIEYNCLARLPNSVRGTTLLGVAHDYKLSLAPPYPNIVIAAGRRLAPVARFIKQHNPATKLVHIMRPQAPLEAFEYIILPEHDTAPSNATIIRSAGALSEISEARLHDAAAIWAPHLSLTPEPRTSILIGGSSKAGAMLATDIDALLDAVLPIVKSEGGSVLVTTSRRTPENCIKRLKTRLEGTPHMLHLYGAKGANPYAAFLALAARIIVSGDSVSMCSEAAFTSKPVYVFEGGFMTPKHRDYASSLYRRGACKPLHTFDPKWQGGNSLDEAARIADEIRDNLR